MNWFPHLHSIIQTHLVSWLEITRWLLIALVQFRHQSFPGGSVVKKPSANAGHTGSIPGSGRSPGEGNGNPLQYSCLGNPMDRGAWWATVCGVTKVRHNWATNTSSSSQCQVCFPNPLSLIFSPSWHFPTFLSSSPTLTRKTLPTLCCDSLKELPSGDEHCSEESYFPQICSVRLQCNNNSMLLA